MTPVEPCFKTFETSYFGLRRRRKKTAWYINKIYIGRYTSDLKYIIIDLKLFAL